MKFIALAAALTAIPALASAAAAQPAPQTVSVAQGVDPAVWEGQADSGVLVHRASRVALPEELNGLRRSRVSSLSSDDVAVGYRLRKGKTETVATLYLFKPKTLREHSLKGSVASFAELSPAAFVWASGPFQVNAATPLRGHKGTFKTGIGPDTQMDYLYFFELGEWTVKIRATLNGVDKIEDEIAIDDFVRKLPWEAILSANGACAGAACTTPAVQEVEHHIMESTLGQMLAAGMKFDPKKEAQLPVAERASLLLAPEAEIRRSSDGTLLYVTEVKGLATYRLIRIPEPATKLLTESFGRLTVDKPLYGLLISLGGSGLMPRLYLGEPTPEAFAAAVGDLVLSETDPMMLPVAKLAERIPGR